jgi:hypothetical protein
MASFTVKTAQGKDRMACLGVAIQIHSTRLLLRVSCGQRAPIGSGWFGESLEEAGTGELTRYLTNSLNN